MSPHAPITLAPTTLTDALTALAAGARPVAGGTDLYPALEGRRPRTPLCDLTRIAELAGIHTAADGAVTIGATTRWSTLATTPLPPALTALGQAAGQIGALQIQNAGTIGGNLVNASPAADGVPPLLLLDATVRLAGPTGRRDLPLADFLTGPRQTALGPGELLTAIHLPPPPPGRSAFVKLGSRAHLVISFVMVAVLLNHDGNVITNARICVGACSPVARRLPELERTLTGQPLTILEDPDVITNTHLAPLDPIDDIRADAAYRRHAARQLIARALSQAARDPAAPAPRQAGARP